MQEALYYLTPDGKNATLQPNGKVLVQGADSSLPGSWYEEDDPRLTPMQRIRHLEADSGYQNYTDNLFTAQKVTLSRFEVPGHKLVETFAQGNLLMKGLAESVEFSLGGKEVNFRAHQLKATFYMEGDLL